MGGRSIRVGSSDLERLDAKGQISVGLSIIMHKPFDLEPPNLQLRHLWRGVFSGVRHVPIPPSQGVKDPDVPKFLGSPPCMHTAQEMATKFCMVIEVDVRKT